MYYPKKFPLRFTLSLFLGFYLAFVLSCSDAAKESEYVGDGNEYSVGGAITGLTADGLVLANTGVQGLPNITVNTGETSFTFDPQLDASHYRVEIISQPAGLECQLASNEGDLRGGNVASVVVDCHIALVFTTDALDRTVDLLWNDTGAIRYKLYYSTQAGINPTGNTGNITVVDDISSPYRLSGLSNGTAYYFILEAQYSATVSRSTEQGTRPNPLASSGSVRAIATDADGTTYIGGTFRAIDTATGSGIPFSETNGRPTRADFPMVDGVVNVVISDGQGGWYIGGSFEAVGNFPAKNLAHIRQDGSVDPMWNRTPDGYVNALLLANSVLYVGGSFTLTVDSIDYVNYVEYLERNGLTAGGNNVQPNGIVNALATDGSRIFIGGEFTNIAGSDLTPYMAAIDLVGNLQTSWLPNLGGPVYALAVKGNNVYAGGSFTLTSGNTVINNLAAIAISDNGSTIGAGTVDETWTPNPQGVDSFGVVRAIQWNGDNLFVGGGFTGISGRTDIQYLAVLGTDGTPSASLPLPNGPVNSVAVNGDRLYAGGEFTTVSDQSRTYPIKQVSAMNITDGTVDGNWAPNPNGFVYDIAVSRGIAYTGGGFTSLSYQRPQINRLAKLDPNGVLDRSWAPNPNSTVRALQKNGSTLYVGGRFTQIGGETAIRYLAALDTNGNPDTNWTPNPDDEIWAMALDGASLYVGGYFTDIAIAQANKTLPIPYLAKVNTADGSVVADWIPNPANAVEALAVGGGTVYAGGSFLDVNGDAARRALVAIDGNGNATSVLPGVPGRVGSLALSGDVLYVGGNFDSVNTPTPFTISNLFAVNVVNGAVYTNWNPDVSNLITDSVDAIVVDSGRVFLAGDFESVGALANRHLAAASAVVDNTSTGNVIAAWNPNADRLYNQFYALHARNGIIYIGGGFDHVGRPYQMNFTKIDVNGNVQ